MLIGLCGYKQSGKSTVTNYLKKHYGFKEVLWAYPLKEIIGRKLFELDDDILYGDSPKREEVIPLWGKSGRQILQLVGTELFRNNFDPDFWVKATLPKLKRLLTRRAHVVVSDCRFPNEMQAVKELGGITCRVVKLGQERTDLHASETSLDEYKTDWLLQAGHGELPWLYEQVDTLMEDFE